MMDKRISNMQPGSGAVFNAERTHRYILWRKWDDRPMVQFIGLNPSTANETDNDATIRRLISFSIKLKYGGFLMTNLFSYISTYPSDLTIIVGSEKNDQFLKDARSLSKDVVYCWGDFDFPDRIKQVQQIIGPAKCFGINKSGSPKHPLYLPGDTKLIRWPR